MGECNEDMNVHGLECANVHVLVARMRVVLHPFHLCMHLGNLEICVHVFVFNLCSIPVPVLNSHESGT